MNIAETVDLDIDAFVGRSVAVLGITGSGKTNTAAVLIEELLSGGLPLTIVDIEGEYYGLKQKFDLLIAGRSEHAELEVTPENAGVLATASVTRGLSVILDLSDYAQAEMYAFLVEYFTTLWEVASKLKKPYEIVLEEAHEFLPQGVGTPLKQILTRIALRGRKRGLGMILMSQRSAKVEKDVLTQTSLLFLHKVVHPTDMKVYNDLIPLPSKEVESMVGSLRPGQVVMVSNHVPQVAHIRLRDTFHAGSTPTLGEVVQPELRRVDASLLQELQKILAATSPRDTDERTLEKRVKELEGRLAERDALLLEQTKQIELLSRLSVSMQGRMQTEVIPPPSLEIGQATIEKATVNHASMSVSTAPPTIAPAQMPLLVSAPMHRQHTPPIHQQKVDALNRRFKQLKPQQYAFLKVLVDRNELLSIEEIAAWLNLAPRTVYGHIPPNSLFTLGILKRSSYRNGYKYQATLKAYLAKEFPGTEPEQLLVHLLP